MSLLKVGVFANISQEKFSQIDTVYREYAKGLTWNHSDDVQQTIDVITRIVDAKSPTVKLILEKTRKTNTHKKSYFSGWRIVRFESDEYDLQDGPECAVPDLICKILDLLGYVYIMKKMKEKKFEHVRIKVLDICDVNVQPTLVKHISQINRVQSLPNAIRSQMTHELYVVLSKYLPPQP